MLHSSMPPMAGSQFISKERLNRLFRERRERQKYDQLQKKLKTALRNFRSRKKERGSVVFIGLKGERSAKDKGKRGYAIYVDTKGRKKPLRQFGDYRTRRLPAMPVARKLRSIDIEAIPSKRAKKKFVQSIIAESKAGFVKQLGLRRGRKRLDKEGANEYGGFLKTNWSQNSKAVRSITNALVKAFRNTTSRRSFQVTVMFLLRSGNQFWTASTTQRFEKPDKYQIDKAHFTDFILRRIYAFLARELESRGLVTTGSAKHVGRLEENEGLDREEWTKDGEEWGGRDLQDVEVERIEYRIDTIHFKSGH